MLTPEESKEIEAELVKYPTKQAACIEAMRIVQKHRRWVSDEALQDLAALLDMSTADLDGVATFYNLIFRRPVGRHVIHYCDSVSCWMLGADEQRKHLSDRLRIQPGDTDAEGRFTLVPIVCLGACDHAPVVKIDDDLHLDVTPGKLDQALERYK